MTREQLQVGQLLEYKEAAFERELLLVTKIGDHSEFRFIIIQGGEVGDIGSDTITALRFYKVLQ